jgi:hypothetical protein
MKFALAIFSSIVAAAFSSPVEISSIRADSSFGQNLISRARRVDEANDQDMSWVSGFSIKFQGCHHFTQWNDEAEDENDVRIATKRLVRFRLCPSNYCSAELGAGCKSGYGDYVVDMNTFIAMYLENKEEVMQEKCEQYLENNCGGCEYYDDRESCQNSCLAKAGLSACIEQQGDDAVAQIDVNDYLECAKYDQQYYDDADKEFYLGPYCADNGGKIYMGVFTDNACTEFADENGGRTTWNKIGGGATLPYHSSSLIGAECSKCGAKNDNGYYEAKEFCEGLYTFSGKCEVKLDAKSSLNTNACTFMEGIKITRKNGTIISAASNKNKVASAFIGIFAVSFILLGSYVYYLKTKLDRVKINLSD